MGDDLGVADVPPPVEPGDLVALEHAEYRVVDVVEAEQRFPIAALVKVRPAHLRAAVRTLSSRLLSHGRSQGWAVAVSREAF